MQIKSMYTIRTIQLFVSLTSLRCTRTPSSTGAGIEYVILFNISIHIIINSLKPHGILT